MKNSMQGRDADSTLVEKPAIMTGADVWLSGFDKQAPIRSFVNDLLFLIKRTWLARLRPCDGRYI